MDLALLLKNAAITASKNSYSPYSKFPVGAALVTEKGDIFSGCNVENASYGLTNCAERNAIGQMVSAGIRSFSLMVIYTPTAEPTAPCGACRQVINEFNPDALILSICDGPDFLKFTGRELLPAGFGPHNLAVSQSKDSCNGCTDH